MRARQLAGRTSGVTSPGLQLLNAVPPPTPGFPSLAAPCQVGFSPRRWCLTCSQNKTGIARPCCASRGASQRRAPTQNGTVEIKPICIDERTRLEAYLEPKDPANANKLDLYLLKEIKGKRAPKFDFEGNEGWKMVAYKFKPNPKHGFLRLARHRRPGCYMWAVSCKPGMDCNFDYDFYHNME